jgi:hypothetical protein
MTREIEIEIFDQSEVVSTNILKEKKRDVNELIAELLSIFSNYFFIFIFYRDFVSHEML